MDGSAEYAASLKTDFGVVRTETTDDFLDGGKRLDGRALPAYPFSIVISPTNTVAHKQVGSNGDPIRERLVRLPVTDLAAVANP